MSYAIRMISSSILAAAAVAGLAAGCESAADCTSVCNRYQECFDDDYDVDECIDRCVDHASSDDFDARLNECDACIEERDCVESVFNCANECSDIVP